MLKLSNREELTRRGELIPLIERIALCASSGTRVRAIIESCQSSRELRDWIVYADERNCGIAIRVYDTAPAATPLRRHINYALQAKKLVRCFKAQQGVSPLYLQDSGACPADWHAFRVSLGSGDLLCAASLPCPDLVFQGLHQMYPPTKVVVALQAHVAWSERIAIGAVQVFRDVLVAFVGVGIDGYLVASSEGGVMTVSKVDVEGASKDVSQQSVQIRVDLGEIELTLAEVAGLRAGAKLELAVDFPLQCYLRVGSTTLGMGEISRVDGGVQLILKEMIG